MCSAGHQVRPVLMQGSNTLRRFLLALERADEQLWPFRHWMLRDILDPETLAGLKEWPHAAPEIRYTLGRREENNPTRRYVDADAIKESASAKVLAEAFQDPPLTAAIETHCGVELTATNLRIEYAQDVEGFWLEPHTDIGVKVFTMFVYLDDGDEPRDWGTDLFFDGSTHAKRLPFVDNSGMIFVPSEDTWHGFLPRAIDGVRRSLIFNYVTSDWRNRHELAFPDKPIG